MHPSRFVSLCLLVASVLVVANGVAAGVTPTLESVAAVGGGFVLFMTSVYGLVRYEEEPIVTEYGALTYLLIAGVVLLAIGSGVQLVAR